LHAGGQRFESVILHIFNAKALTYLKYYMLWHV
jgi:hypothetical protein